MFWRVRNGLAPVFEGVVGICWVFFGGGLDVLVRAKSLLHNLPPPFAFGCVDRKPLGSLLCMIVLFGFKDCNFFWGGALLFRVVLFDLVV